jgi:nucleoside-diphosphate-sugar epimerase
MRVFVTGAAGWVGQALVKELLDHGHQVLGLVRNDANAAILTKAGAEVHRGDLEDLESLKSGAKAADAIAHLAFIHDFTNMAHSTAVDRAAIEAMAEAIAGTGKPLIITTGTLIVKTNGEVATEDSEIERELKMNDRWKSEDLILSLAKEKNIRGMVVRLSPTTHGAGDKGFAAMFVTMARKAGRAVYIGDGSARWPAVHRRDAAVLFRLALEKGASGAIYHAVAEQGVRLKDTMTLIGNRLQVPVESQSVEQAVPTMGFFAYAMVMDKPTSSDKTQKELGWSPKEDGLLADMDKHYFNEGAEQSGYKY